MDPIQALFLQSGQSQRDFPANSRYHRTPTASYQHPQGETLIYLKRRFVPAAEHLRTMQYHRLQQGERLDHIAYRHLQDPEAFWQICDANGVMHPPELEERLNERIRITYPQGL